MIDQSKLRARILGGNTRTQPVFVPEFETDGCGGYLGDEEINEDCDGVIQVRPLTDLEQSEVDHAMVDGQTVRGKPNEKTPADLTVNVATSQAGQARGRRMRVAYGMSCQGAKWAPSDIGKLPPSAVRRIDAVVRELSGGGGLEEEVRQFRPDTGGSGDSDPASDGDPAGDEPG